MKVMRAICRSVTERAEVPKTPLDLFIASNPEAIGEDGNLTLDGFRAMYSVATKKKAKKSKSAATSEAEAAARKATAEAEKDIAEADKVLAEHEVTTDNCVNIVADVVTKAMDIARGLKGEEQQALLSDLAMALEVCLDDIAKMREVNLELAS